MIRIHLSRLMGERKERIADLARATGLTRNTLSGLYYEQVTRLDIDTLAKLCKHFKCDVGDLIECVHTDDKKAEVERPPVRG